jgi:hypothetical protein
VELLMWIVGTVIAAVAIIAGERKKAVYSRTDCAFNRGPLKACGKEILLFQKV